MSSDKSPLQPIMYKAAKQWRPRVEMRWRVQPISTSDPPALAQLWQCEQTGELWWRRVPTVEGWESDEP